MNKNKIYLAQTDTTIGFLSSNDKKLSSIKKRPHTQKILEVVDSLRTLKNKTRIPNKFKNLIRKSKEITFIYPNKNSYRLVSKYSKHYDFLSKFESMYSTSANETNKSFDVEFASKNSNVVVYTRNNFYESNSSKIYKITNNNIQKIR